jgi:hypothetical protein
MVGVGYGMDIPRHIDTREPSPPPVPTPADIESLESLLSDNSSLRLNLVACIHSCHPACYDDSSILIPCYDGMMV